MNFLDLTIFNSFQGKKTPNDIENLEKNKSELALEFSSIGVWEYDARKNRVYFSEGSKQIIGVTNPDFGKNPQDWNDRVHPEDRERYFQNFQDHINGLLTMYDNIHRVKCEDNTYKWIRDRGKIVEWFPNGRYKRIIGTHTDVTALKDAETKTKNALDIATEQNNRLKNFAHIVTHNLRQHTGNLESLLKLYTESKDGEEKEDIYKHLLSLSNSFSKTINDLNTVVSVQANKNKRVEKIFLAKSINHTLEMLDVVIKRSNAIVNNNINEKIYLYYNKSYFESIIQNLVSNAIKYKHPDRDPIANIDCTINKEVLELRISDNGIGIDLEKFGNDVFSLYKTFHNHPEAEGVGLYLIKNQIESYGGTITLESTPGKGTTFIIKAPNNKAPTI